MSRGAPEHASNEAAQLLANVAVAAIREKMDRAVRARLRAASTNDTEECRGAVAAFQACEALWEGLDRMANQNIVREAHMSEVV